MFIIGFGTGRCGTNSLTALLAKQKGYFVTHEAYLLPFENDIRALFEALTTMVANDGGHELQNLESYRIIKEALEDDDHASLIPVLRTLFKKKKIVDVAYYWLDYVEDLIRIFPDMKAVCLYRDRRDVVNSFVNHVGLFNDRWKNFPWYRDISRSLVRQYYDDYYDRAAKLAIKHPDNVKYFVVPRVFERKPEMKSLFDWLRIPEKDRTYQTGIRISQTGKDGPVVSFRDKLCQRS